MSQATPGVTAFTTREDVQNEVDSTGLEVRRAAVISFRLIIMPGT